MNEQNIEKNLQLFFEKFAILQHYQRITDQITKQTIKELQERDNQISQFEPSKREIYETSLDVFSIYNPYTGINQPYSIKKTSIKEKARQIHLHKNRQYQWLLVEAYEFFEDYVISLYELVCDKKIELRLSKDKDRLFPRYELKKRSIQIINHFRNILPELRDIEKNNKLQKNLRLDINMIETFRHIIVHKNGKTENPEEIIEKILKASCLFSDKVNAPSAEAEIRDYLGSGDIKGLIVLVEKTLVTSPGFSMHINRHEELTNSLLSYALVLSQCLINHIAQEET